MSDAVTSKTMVKGRTKLVMQFTNISDGSGESAVIKVDKSALIGPDGVNEPSKISIEEVQWGIQGFASVRILFDHTTDDVGLVLPAGTGYMSFKGAGGLQDPGGTGGTGDLLFTTSGTTSGNSYDITLVLKLKQ